MKILLIALTIIQAWAGEKLAHGLETATGKVDVLIQYYAEPSAADGLTVQKHGGVVRISFGKSKSSLVSVSVAALASLAQDPAIRYISPNRTVSARLDYALPTVGAYVAASYGLTGEGIGVIIDSGIDNHWNLANSTVGANGQKETRIVYAESFVPGQL